MQKCGDPRSKWQANSIDYGVITASRMKRSLKDAHTPAKSPPILRGLFRQMGAMRAHGKRACPTDAPSQEVRRCTRSRTNIMAVRIESALLAWVSIWSPTNTVSLLQRGERQFLSC